MPIVALRGVSFTYRGGERPALSEIDLTVERGEFVVIAGPSGCGKTTLARCINGLIPHFYEGDYCGEVEVDGLRVANTETYKLSSVVGYVFQNPDSQIVMTTVERDLAFGLENLGLSREEIRDRIAWAAEVLGITGLLKKRPSELSMGQKQRVAIAGVIAMRPKVLIVDEPTAYISPLASAKLLDFIYRELSRKLRITVILIEHKLELAARYASKVVVMHSGEIIAAGPPRDVLTKESVAAVGVAVPMTCRIYVELRRSGVLLERIPLTPDELAEMVTGDD